MELLLNWVLYAQLALCVFIVVPFAQGGKNHLMSFASKQAWVQHVKYVWLGLAALVGLSCYAHHQSLHTYTEMMAASETFVPSHKEHQLEAERDRLLSGLVLVLLLLLHRASSLMLEGYSLSVNNAALTSQLKNASAFAAMQLADTQPSPAPKKVAKQVPEAKAEDQAKKEKDTALRMMALEKELERVNGENKKLKGTLADYEAMLGDDKKKHDKKKD